MTLGYSIQAKKAYFDNTGFYEYRELGQGGELAGERQYDTLIRHSSTYGSIPVHIFYNGWVPSKQIAFAASAPFAHYGCAAVSTYVVRDIRARSKGNGLNRASHYAPVSYPWSDLFRLPTPHTSGSLSVGATGPSGATRRGDAITTSETDLVGLARWMSEIAGHGIQFSPTRALPDYVLQTSDLSVAKLPKDSRLPQFAVVLSEG